MRLHSLRAQHHHSDLIASFQEQIDESFQEIQVGVALNGLLSSHPSAIQNLKAALSQREDKLAQEKAKNKDLRQENVELQEEVGHGAREKSASSALTLVCVQSQAMQESNSALQRECGELRELSEILKNSLGTALLPERPQW